MSLDVEKALSMDILKDAVLVGGKKGIKREIHFVSVMEVPDISDWVSEGELLMTTGYPFKDSILELVRLIKKLNSKRVTGMAFKTKRFVNELPDEILQVADELGFPLIILPPNARFAKIISELMAQIIEGQYLEHKKSIEIQNNLTNLIITGGKFNEIALTLSSICRCDVEIQESSGNIIAKVLTSSGGPEESAEVKTHVHQEKIMLSKEIIGYIILTSKHGPFDKGDCAAINYAAKILAMIMIKHETSKEKDQRLKMDFLNSVIEGKIESREVLLERGKSFGINMNITYIVYAFMPYESGDKNDGDQLVSPGIKILEKSIADAFASIAKICISWALPDKVVALFPIQPQIDNVKKRSSGIAQSLHRYLADIAGLSPISIGIGTYHQNSLDVYKSYNEAVHAINIGNLIFGGAGVYHYDDLGIYRLLIQIVNTESADRYIQSLLGRLLDYDRQKSTQLVDTLEQLIDSGNLKEAAHNLYVHPKTLAQRKSKIEDILELSIDSPQTRLDLSAAIKLHRLKTQ